MGGGPEYPKPSAQELELQRQQGLQTGMQTQMMQQYMEQQKELQRRNELLAPILYKQSGLIPQYEDVPSHWDPVMAREVPGERRLVGFTETPGGTAEEQARQQQLALQRQQMDLQSKQLGYQIGQQSAEEEFRRKQMELQSKQLGYQLGQQPAEEEFRRKQMELASQQLALGGQASSYQQQLLDLQKGILPQQMEYQREQLALQRELARIQGAQLPAQAEFQKQQLGLQTRALAIQETQLPMQAELQREQIALMRQGMTQSEAAQTAQMNLMQRQARLQDMLMPISLEQAGYQATRDPTTGEITAISRKPLTQAQLIGQQVEQAAAERSLAALQGRLPVNPALMKQMEQQDVQLNETLRRQLGPGYETSTPGIQALSEWQERKASILEGARRGDLGLMEQVSLARAGQGSAENATALQQLQAGTSAPLGLMAGYNQLRGGNAYTQQPLSFTAGPAYAPSGLPQTSERNFNMPQMVGMPQMAGIPGATIPQYSSGVNVPQYSSGATMAEMMAASQSPYAGVNYLAGAGGAGPGNALGYYANERQNAYQASLRNQGGGAKGALGGAASGAMAGSMFGPWGAAAGGVIGGVTGYFG